MSSGSGLVFTLPELTQVKTDCKFFYQEWYQVILKKGSTSGYRCIDIPIFSSNILTCPQIKLWADDGHISGQKLFSGSILFLMLTLPQNMLSTLFFQGDKLVIFLTTLWPSINYKFILQYTSHEARRLECVLSAVFLRCDEPALVGLQAFIISTLPNLLNFLDFCGVRRRHIPPLWIRLADEPPPPVLFFTLLFLSSSVTLVNKRPIKLLTALLVGRSITCRGQRHLINIVR